MTTETSRPAAGPDKQALLAEFVRRIEAGEFNGDDKFHRFVQKEIFPLLTAGTLTGKDLEYLTLQFSRTIHALADGARGAAGDGHAAR